MPESKCACKSNKGKPRKTHKSKPATKPKTTSKVSTKLEQGKIQYNF